MKKMMVCYSNYSGEKSQFFNTILKKTLINIVEKIILIFIL